MDEFLSKYHCDYHKDYSAKYCALAVLKKWKYAIGDKKSFEALSTVLSKGFDCLSHELLLAKLHAEAVSRRCSVKKMLLKISQNLQENTCARTSFLTKLQARWLQKKTLAQVFFCGFSEIFQNNFFIEHLLLLFKILTS